METIEKIRENLNNELGRFGVAEVKFPQIFDLECATVEITFEKTGNELGFMTEAAQTIMGEGGEPMAEGAVKVEVATEFTTPRIRMTFTMVNLTPFA